MSGSVPAWKQAILDRKKQQQKEEELKQAEKEAYLSSLPPWKRALFLKKEKGAGDTVGASQQNIAKGPAKPTARQQQSTVTPSATTKNKPQTTAPEVGSNVPAWKQKESPSSSINDSITKQQQGNVSSPVNTNNNNSDKGPSWNKKIAPVVAETPSQKDTSTALPAVVNGTDNIPLWKRNLLQRQATGSNTTGDKSPQPVNMKVTDTPQTSVAIGSPKVYGKFSNAGSGSTVRSHALNTKTTETSMSPSRPRAKSVGTYDDYDDDRLASLPPWKRDLILRKRAASAAAKEKQTTEVTEPTAPVVKVTRRESMEKDSGWRKTVHNSSENSNLLDGKDTVRRLSDDKISMWKKKAAVDQSKLVKRSSQEIDPAKLEACDSPQVEHKTPAQQDVQPTATQHASNNVTLVNGPEKEENDESAPPILRGKDPWAHLSESDPQFKALPLWKQALILRRRGDIRRRSNPDFQIDGGSSSSTNTEAEDEPDFTEVPAWKKEALLKRPAEKADEDEATPVFDDPDMPEWKKEKLRKSFQDKKKTHSTSLPVLISKKEMSNYQSDASIPEWKKEAMREKESLKKTNSDIPEWKKEAMKEKQSVKSDDNDIPEWKKEKAMKEKQSVKSNDSDIPEWKKEKKQTAEKSNANIPEWKKEATKEKKSEKNHSVPLLTSIRPLSPDKSNPSTSPVKQYSPQPIDETDYHNSNHVVDDDDDDDDVPCTNIDDLSDSDESVGGSGSYDVNQDSTSMHVESTSSSSGYSSDNSNTQGMKRQKTSKSILIIRKVSNPQYKRHRRVSWNEEQMRTEHTYPKYDYADYDQLNEEAEIESTDSSMLSHPIHPSLGNRTSRNSDELSNYRPNIVSSYTVTVSTTKTEPVKKEEPKTEPVAMPAEDPEFNMSNLSDDVAALLF